MYEEEISDVQRRMNKGKGFSMEERQYVEQYEEERKNERKLYKK